MKNPAHRIATPLVSVGLPTRNRAHLLRSALAALLAQTYRNIEYIVSDNASTDDTELAVREFATKDPRIRYIRQERDINGMENHEFVLREARGEYFMWASDDDSWDPRFVEKLLGALQENPSYGVAMSHYWKRTIQDGPPRAKLVAHDFTHLSHRELYRKYLRGRITPVFFFGLYRTDILRRIFRRKTPSCFNGLLLTLAEVALATRSLSVPEPLHTQLQDTRLHIVRHPTNPYTVGELEPFAVTRYVLTIPWWLFTSAAIPLSRKRLILGPWLSRVWLYKRKIARELWRFLKHSIVPVRGGRRMIDTLLDRWLISASYMELGDLLFKLGKLAKQDRAQVAAALRERMKGSGGDAAKRLEFLETRLLGGAR